MPTRDQRRIETDRTRPRMLELWWALQPLKSVVRFMQSGAHPDDETSAMMAALAFRDGLNISYACSTRGEGGQNVIGTEAGADLGALRTREMERACDVLGMRMYWLSETPDDPITDFGFSKNGDETLEKWGHARTLARFVEIVRTERPDILCPTFLDVPGQHGHHRAMTQAAHQVMTAAADPDFPSNLPPWQVAKLYLPAWSGAGQSYDDDLPPPPATLTIDGTGRDPVSGWSWPRIGEQSRAFHRTQGMGHWPGLNASRNWPLHLALSFADGPDQTVLSGLPQGVADLARVPGATPIADDLLAAQALIDSAIDTFPHGSGIADHAAEAIALLRRAMSNCPLDARAQILHRLKSKEAQLARVLRLALGIEVSAEASQDWLEPGEAVSWRQEVFSDQDISAAATPHLPMGWEVKENTLSVAPDTVPTDAYRPAYDPLSVPAPALDVTLSHNGVTATDRVALDAVPVLLPARRAGVSPDHVLINLTSPERSASIQLTPDAANIDAPDGWGISGPSDDLRLEPFGRTEGLFTLPVTISGIPAATVRRISHDHVENTATFGPAQVKARVLNIKVPAVKVGYVGGGNDRVGHWLRALGADVADLTDADLSSAARLSEFDTVVVGIFAMKARPALSKAMLRIHEWVAAGGTLVTLYHRPWDNWDPDTVPPKRIEIGQPSLRWRVTDQTAEVHHLTDHPILTSPNPIGPETWEGWVKERGLYFAKSWDDAYIPLIEMSDPGEAPHRGALLVADIGQGRHIHTSLILHHQMEHLVPGAFRLIANFIARRE